MGTSIRSAARSTEKNRQVVTANDINNATTIASAGRGLTNPKKTGDHAMIRPRWVVQSEC